MNNPLLEKRQLPAFDRIRPEHVEPAIDDTLAAVRERVARLLDSGAPFTWDNLAAPLESALEQLNRVWSPVSHMNSVVNSDELRAAYNACLPKLSAFATELGQHNGLHEAFKGIAASEAFSALNQAQRKAIDNRLRDFRLTGIDLGSAQRERFKEIQQRLAELQAKFQENLLDATNGWQRLVTDESVLSGLPATALALARQAAQKQGLVGWLFTLDFPSYHPVLTYADDRALREEFYTAYTTRASDSGPHAGRWDNTAIMEETLQLRHEAARLLGFDNFGERSLATKMASSPDEVLAFLDDLAQRALKHARRDLDEVHQFAAQMGATFALEAWDIPWYSEKLRQHRYALSQQELRPYFPHSRVVSGLFAVASLLFGIKISERKNVPVWHPDVRFFEIYDASGELRGQFYLDLFARPKKQGGAWMGECRTRSCLNGEVDVPAAYLTCNFTPPVGGQPALLSHEEVITLFHEFGHGLHHLLSRVDCPSVSGINGVAWDAIELPSQFMENWCWQREALNLFSGHHETDEPLPDEMFERMQASRNFQSAMQMVRQVEFALFDMHMHVEYDPARGGRIYETLDRVRQKVAVVQPPPFTRFAHGFAHVFGGGYAAGYYSYKWAEVLASDAFSLFEENGIFDRETGLHFMREILEQGGARDPMELFIAFRGRQPAIDALLRHSGLSA